MGIDPVDASNACIPPQYPLTCQSLPLPSANRGEPVYLDGDGGRLNEKEDNRRPLLMYAVGKLIVVREIDLESGEMDGSHGNGGTTCSASSSFVGPDGRPSTRGFVYRGHSAAVTAAKFNPSGSYVASGDSKGKLRIWAYDHEEHLPKIELSVLAGPVRDICWDAEGKRLAVVGEGLQSPECAKVLQWDSGVKCGDLGQHLRRKASSVAFRPRRPMRIATAGTEDSSVLFHKGPPFARVVGEQVCEKAHDRGAVHAIRYDRDGGVLASVGTDGNVCFYDGKDMRLLHKMDKVHSSSIFGCAWNRQGTHLLTCGADGYARLIDAAAHRVACEWDVAAMHSASRTSNKAPIGAMQLGCAFIKGDVPVSVGFNGQIAILPMPNDLAPPASSPPRHPPRLITGHQAPISAMAFADHDLIYTADTDGVIIQWDGRTGNPNGRVTPAQEDLDISGKVHAGATVSSLLYSHDNTLYSAGWDDHIRIITDKICHDKIPLTAQPNAMTRGTRLIVVMTVDGLVLLPNTTVIPLPYTATAITLSKDDSTLYVSGDDCNIYIYSVHHPPSPSSSSNPLQQKHVIRGGHLKPIQSLALSHDQTKLAAADVRDVCLYDTNDWTPIVSKGRWCFHTQPICCLAWSQDDSILASGGNDDDIFLWCWKKKTKRIHYRFAHRGGVTGLGFRGWMLVSTGNDGCVNWWNVEGDVQKKFH